MSEVYVYLCDKIAEVFGNVKQTSYSTMAL